MNKDEKSIKEKLNIAIDHHKNQKFQSAEKLYKEILSVDENDAEVIFNLGTLYSQMKKFSLAKSLLLKADDLNPNNLNINLNIGSLLYNEGDTELALKYFDKVIKIQSNFALAYFMSEKKAFPENTDLIETLEFYFQCCSIELKSPSMASAAATLANGGVNPLTGKKVFSASTAKNCLSLMNSCGMYDFSGEYAFKIGFPAKSGVSGAMLIVIPNVMGICVWSPNLDELGNSVRGVEFSKKLGERFNFHNYDSLINNNDKIDPRKNKYENKIDNVIGLIYAASHGDVDEIKKIEAKGIDLNSADYDGRTALHLAASEGQAEVVEYLIRRKVKADVKDRWGGTPSKDAKRGKHKIIVELLENYLAN